MFISTPAHCTGAHKSNYVSSTSRLFAVSRILAHMARADHNVLISGDSRQSSLHVGSFDLVNNRIVQARLHSLPCRTNMAASVYCSGKVLRTFGRNCQSKNANTCKYNFSKLPINVFLDSSSDFTWNFINYQTNVHFICTWIRSKSNVK